MSLSRLCVRAVSTNLVGVGAHAAAAPPVRSVSQVNHGRLDTADTSISNATAYHERKLAVSGSPSVTTRENLGTADSCGASGCPLYPMYPTGDGRVLYQTVYEGKAVLRLVDKAKPAPGRRSPRS